MKGKYLSNLAVVSMIVALIGVTAPGIAVAGAYPKGGQSEQQQELDKFQCHEWSVKDSGYNPNASTYRYQASSSAPSGESGVFGQGRYGEGGGVSDAGKGAVFGALGGAIAGDAGKGAAIGALSGLFIGSVKRSNRATERRRWEEQQAAQAKEQQGADQAAYNRAYRACMHARNYEIY